MRRLDRVVRPIRLVAATAAGYLVGTFPSADIATRLATGGSTDLRSTGSGNPGRGQRDRSDRTRVGLRGARRRCRQGGARDPGWADGWPAPPAPTLPAPPL